LPVAANVRYKSRTEHEQSSDDKVSEYVHDTPLISRYLTE